MVIVKEQTINVVNIYYNVSPFGLLHKGPKLHDTNVERHSSINKVFFFKVLIPIYQYVYSLTKIVKSKFLIRQDSFLFTIRYISVNRDMYYVPFVINLK